ncbi:MAG: LPS export ABC transporter permease LptG [Roseomonas sp.]|jgi:lipopolysaccharide export system permease protein|nr:LPS export ABC transporter permease LptG [Roseomonas sp.]MCA3427310.1 LPS export ABC transporter permease LptG [Roseomonas sp.]MCA3429926.1 LPS export ABC transporter permease LptG [Roseomonas sp.]MCA3432169.1 LPS export ABC transporter permease LptG [Roseomonas sp.]MCZ8141062.1 LPS export ABC transporter permease LptG [Acetobacteraceae bacterium]
MTLPITLMTYVARRFAAMALLMVLALSALVALFDLIELLRRAATRPEANFALVSQIAALRVPYVAMQILPFAVLLGGIIAFWRLTRFSELVVARAAGISAWGFLAGPVLVALLLGLGASMALSPLSSAMLARAERLDQLYLRNVGGITALAGGRLWLRQADDGLQPQGVAIISGRPIATRELRPGEALRLAEVTVWRLSAEDRPLARIEATSALLQPGRWRFDGAMVFGADRVAGAPQSLDFPTELTPERIENSFASPDTLSLWALPEFITVLENAGFSAIRHRLYFQSLLALPLLAIAMALLAAGFSMRSARRGGVARMIAGGVSAGFALFVLDKVTGEFGEAGTLPVVLAAWAPAGAGFLLAAALLLHLEDG